MIKNTKIIFLKRLKDLKSLFTEKSVTIIDENVFVTYQDLFKEIKKLIVIPCVEDNKTLNTACEIYKKLSNFKIDRTHKIIACGGGVMLDIASFVASTYLRGLELISIPTTLLAQADTCLGGKNAVNLESNSKLIKNQIGTFYNSKETYIVPGFLRTLKKDQINAGLFEVIKHAIISSDIFFDYISSNLNKLSSINFLSELVKTSLDIKEQIVKKDVYDFGLRKTLNLGHTFAHAFESTYNLNHGRAVLFGIKYSLGFSKCFKYIKDNDAKKIESLINKFITKEDYKMFNNINKEELFDKIKKDKKAISESIDFVYIKKIGKVFVKNTSLDELFKIMDKLSL